ncbi:hypothetical protein HAX54_046675 [Datura stramonium]|uniref:Uncharacterized protein n=1 Tax=Datura stramonium TaxID=4076 RepID=A0ABS8RQC0_DATST|nr:hypothetical protein [Datura stramonium]
MVCISNLVCGVCVRWSKSAEIQVSWWQPDVLNDLIPRNEVDDGSLLKKSTGSTSSAEKGKITDGICLRLCAVQEKPRMEAASTIVLYRCSGKSLPNPFSSS